MIDVDMVLRVSSPGTRDLFAMPQTGMLSSESAEPFTAHRR